VKPEDNQAAAGEQKQDDFRLINGIGPSFSDALQDIGITSFSELAEYKPASLARALKKGTGVRVSAKKIKSEQWIEQALELSQAKPVEVLAPEEMETSIENQKKVVGAVNSPHWRQQAGFTLFFDYQKGEEGVQEWRTRVYHDESGEETQFSTLSPKSWLDWMARTGKLLIPELQPSVETQLKEDQVYEAGEVETERIPEIKSAPIEIEKGPQAEITDVQLSIIGPTDLFPQKRLKVDTDFRIKGEIAKLDPQVGVHYRVEIFTENLESGAITTEASELGNLEEGAENYTNEQTFPIPEIGQHQLHTVVFLLASEAALGYHKGPVFRVVP
jgi:hypothetical protein